jgi:hypothetical protein
LISYDCEVALPGLQHEAEYGMDSNRTVTIAKPHCQDCSMKLSMEWVRIVEWSFMEYASPNAVTDTTVIFDLDGVIWFLVQDSVI